MCRRHVRRASAICVAAVAFIVLTAVPVNAEPGSGGGVIVGVVNSTGVPTDPGDCANAYFTFASNTINGAITIGPDASGHLITVVGSLRVFAQGATTGPSLGCLSGAGESALLGTGNVVVTSCQGAGIVVADTLHPLTMGPTPVRCALAGAYVRVGTQIAVELHGWAEVYDWTEGRFRRANDVAVHVSTQFMPTALACAVPLPQPLPPPLPQDRPTCITQASIAGAWTLVADN